MDRYRTFARQLFTILGLGAPLAACSADQGPARDPRSDPAPRGFAAPPHDAATTTTTTTTTTTRPPPRPFGPFPSPEHYGEGEVTCVPRPQDNACPPTAILVNGHGRTEAPFRFEQGDTCCYGPAAPGFHWRGRALRGPGGIALAAVADRADWMAATALDAATVPEASRAELADTWARDAAFEHASVASFARLALELIALGAPAVLVADACRAALDEIGHAELAYGVAGRLAGRALGPAPLPAAATAPRPDLAALVRDCVRDGCYGETVAVMLARAAADATSDPVLREAYDRIAADEQRHAELAFRIVAWAIARDPAARRAAATERAALAATMADAADGAAAAVAAVDLSRFGVLTATAEAAVRARAVEAIVLPCLDALIAQTPGTSPN